MHPRHAGARRGCSERGARAARREPLLGIHQRTRITKGPREREHLFRALANSIANLAWMELREREQPFRHDAELPKRLLYSLFMQAPTLIAVLRGPEHIVELANPPVCTVWGRTEKELLNQPLLDVRRELRDQAFSPLLSDVTKAAGRMSAMRSPHA